MSADESPAAREPIDRTPRSPPPGARRRVARGDRPPAGAPRARDPPPVLPDRDVEEGPPVLGDPADGAFPVGAIGRDRGQQLGVADAGPPGERAALLV